jgi:hypothetical protein
MSLFRDAQTSKALRRRQPDEQGAGSLTSKALGRRQPDEKAHPAEPCGQFAGPTGPGDHLHHPDRAERSGLLAGPGNLWAICPVYATQNR